MNRRAETTMQFPGKPRFTVAFDVGYDFALDDGGQARFDAMVIECLRTITDIFERQGCTIAHTRGPFDVPDER